MLKLVEEHTMSDPSLSPKCTDEIDLLTLSMLHHFDKTLSRSETYHNLKMGYMTVYSTVSIAKFQVISPTKEPQYVAWLLAWVNP